MTMRDRLQAAMKDAMRAKEAARLSTLRLINAAIKDRDIAARGDGRDDGVSDADILGILGKMVKQRQESARAYEDGGRLELAEKELDEIKVIEEFLPRQLDAGEVSDAIREAIAEAVDEIVAQQNRRIGIPKRFSIPMRELLALQPRFQRREGRRALSFLGHPRFRAAYDFLLLRAEAGEVDMELADWWTDLQDASDEDRVAMVENRPVSEQAAEAPKKSSRRRRRPRRRRSTTGPAADS